MEQGSNRTALNEDTVTNVAGDYNLIEKPTSGLSESDYEDPSEGVRVRFEREAFGGGEETDYGFVRDAPAVHGRISVRSTPAPRLRLVAGGVDDSWLHNPALYARTHT